jgi:hypothetical protein
LELDVRTFTFSYAELKTATEEFSPANKLGEGGFGPVFKVSPYSNQGQKVAEPMSVDTILADNLI